MRNRRSSTLKGLGASYRISTPWGSQTISIPVEDLARDAAGHAWNAAWPPLKGKLMAEMPGFINQGMDVAAGRLRTEMPGLIDHGMDLAYQKLQTAMPGIMDQAIAEVEPNVRAEADRAIKLATNRLMIGVSILSAVIIGSAFVTVRAVRRR